MQVFIVTGKYNSRGIQVYDSQACAVIRSDTQCINIPLQVLSYSDELG